MARPDIWHRKFYVHPIQRKYLYLSLVPLIVCSLAIMILTFLPMQLLLSGRASELDKAVVASCLSTLGSRLLPAIFLSMLLAAILSVFASHALGGPLFRLETVGKRLAAGDFMAPIRVREGDDLQGMAAVLDQAVGNLRDALARIREQAGGARARLEALQGELATGQVPPATLSGRLQEIGARLEGVEETLRPFQI